MLISKIFIISQELQKSEYPEQHKTWNSIRNLKFVDYTDISEIEKIEAYAEEHHVEP